jgi:hypothetical protein
MEPHELINWNRRGLIPGPKESESSFLARCSHSKSITSQTLFDISPDWVHIQYSKQGLRFWEGGCTWIEENQTKIQLHPSLLKNKMHFGYTGQEMLTHELVHAVRSAFDEPIFEEMLAYQTSSSPLRRFWGPLVRTPKESLIGVLAILSFTLLSFFEPFYFLALTSLLTLCGFAILRLFHAQRQFKRALNNISKLVSKERLLSFLLHLSDQEIRRFSHTATDIVSYAHEMAKTSLRWQQIIASYL